MISNLVVILISLQTLDDAHGWVSGREWGQTPEADSLWRESKKEPWSCASFLLFVSEWEVEEQGYDENLSPLDLPSPTRLKPDEEPRENSLLGCEGGHQREHEEFAQ